MFLLERRAGVFGRSTEDGGGGQTTDLWSEGDGVDAEGVGVETTEEVKVVLPSRLRDVDVKEQLVDRLPVVVAVVAAAGDDVGQPHDGDADLLSAGALPVAPPQHRPAAVKCSLHDGEGRRRAHLLQQPEQKR